MDLILRRNLFGLGLTWHMTNDSYSLHSCLQETDDPASRTSKTAFIRFMKWVS